MESTYKLPLVLEPQPEGGYTVTCSLIPELVTEGDSVRDALANASDALGSLIDAYAQLGRSLPTALQQTPPGAWKVMKA